MQFYDKAIAIQRFAELTYSNILNFVNPNMVNTVKKLRLRLTDENGSEIAESIWENR